MLDFLRLLAPQHGDALRSASAMRSRAASMAPEQLVESDDVSPDIAAPTTPAPQREPPRAAMQSPSVGSSDGAAREPGATHVEAVVMPPAAITSEAHASTPPPLQTANAALQHHSFGDRADAEPRLSPPSRRPRSTSTSSGDVDRTVEWSPSMHMTAPVLQAPLSAAAVALHGPTPGPTPAPVIHVSIDRIEVRAPPQPAKPATRPRTAPPVQSLGDYLRGRKGTAP